MLWSLDGGRWPSLDRPRDFATRPSFVEIEFDLYLPTRIQEQLFAVIDREPLEAEHFHVLMHYGDMPVAMVAPVDAAADFNEPSAAVFLVREYLEEQLKSGPLAFTCLGPSPYHGEFFAQPAPAGQTELFVVSRDRRVGYDIYNCTYQSRSVAAADIVLHIAMSELVDELAMFYDISRRRVIQMRAWERIDSAVRSSLLRNKKPSGLKARWKRIVRRVQRGQRLQKLTAMLIMFEMDRLRESAAIDASLSAHYVSDDAGKIREDLETAKKAMGDYPTEQIGRLLQFFERRHSESLKLAIAVIASIIGGAVGAWLTALASGH